MESAEPFVDYYNVLEVSPSCGAKMLEKAYRHFAQKYHPDHPETADVEKFQAVIEAYNVLRDPEKRAHYDAGYKSDSAQAFHFISQDQDIHVDEKSAIHDAEIHEKILYYLYKRRREHAEDPGVIGYFIEKLIDCSHENYEFHIWYLKSKGFINVTEHGTLEITIEGVDHVISMSRAIEERKLLPQVQGEHLKRRAGD